MKNAIIKPNNPIRLTIPIYFHGYYFILGSNKGTKLAVLAMYLVILGTEDSYS